MNYSFVVQKVKRNQHLREITATSMTDVLKPGSCRPVCGPLAVGPEDGKTFVDLLNAHKKQMDTSLATAPVITWALHDVYMEGFVHASTKIRLGSSSVCC